MKISEFNIDGLYSAYSYHMTNLSQQNLLILTGYNGMGKTTILNIVNALAEEDLWYFYTLEFKRITILFENELCLCLVKSESTTKTSSDSSDITDKDIKPVGDYTLEWLRGKESFGTIKIDKRRLYKATSVVCKVEYIPADDDGWIDFMNAEKKDVANFVFKKQNCPTFGMLFASIHAVMIPVQRLSQIVKVSNEDERFPFETPEYENVYTIDIVARNLGKLLEGKRIEFLNSIQKSKNALIDRLLDADIKELGESDYTELANEVQGEINDLQFFGIAYEKVRVYNSNNGKLLSAYLLDLKETLERYSGLLQDLKLFASIIEEKKMLHKKLQFSPSDGLKVFNANGVSIKLSSLSSGEQNIIILLYRIIFEVKDGDILLLDEPENSMHIVWLKEFIQDLQDIANERRNIQMFIATHSPQIAGGAIDCCFDLEFNNDAE